MSTDYMPILGTPFAVRMNALDEVQAQKNHGQSLARLAERGGLSMSEAAAVAEKRKWSEQSALYAATALLQVDTFSRISPSQAAVMHMMKRIQGDPRLAYLIGPGSESFELLVAAAARIEGLETDVLRERVLGWIAPQPVPGIGQAAGVVDQELWNEMLEVNNCALDVDQQASIDYLVNHFVRLGLKAHSAEVDGHTEELF